MAAKVKNAEILEYFCEEGVDVNHTSNKGETPLCICATLFWKEGLEILEKYGAKLDTNAPGAIPILQPVFNKMARKDLWDDQDALDTVEYLIERGANINISLPATEAGPSSPLQVAISKSRSKLFEVLIKANPPMNEALPNGKLPLQQAVERNLIDYVQPLIDAGANIYYLFDDNQSYLHIAANAGSVECFDKLLELYQEKGPDYIQAADDLQEWIEDQRQQNIEDGRGKDRAIILPPIQDRFTVLRKVDPFFVDKNGNTPLIFAARAGNMEICEKLITLGCDPSYENKKRHSAYTVATSENAEKLIEIANRDGMDELFEKLAVLEPYHDTFDKPKPDETSKSILMNSRGGTLSRTGKGKTVKLSQSQLTQRTALLEEKKSTSPPQSPVARAWGGSAEAEEFRRKTRVELRNLKQEMKDRAKELREQIEKLYQEFEVELPQ